MLATTGPCSLDLQAATGWPLPAGATTADLCPRTCGGCQEDAAEADHPVYRASTCAGRLWQAGEVPRVHDIGLAMAPADFRWLVENQARKAVHGRRAVESFRHRLGGICCIDNHRLNHLSGV
jgi:hypothetical protein